MWCVEWYDHDEDKKPMHIGFGGTLAAAVRRCQEDAARAKFSADIRLARIIDELDEFTHTVSMPPDDGEDAKPAREREA
jgi:hypothetical protein